MTADPYEHHPGLRGKINDPLESFFRQNDLRDVMLANPVAEAYWPLLHTPLERKESLDAVLADHAGDCWVFAYGSLMWDPALQYDKVLRAKSPAHMRSFILRDIYGGRGTTEKPGLMAALDDGDGCEGLAFRVPEAIVYQELEILWRREYVGPGYNPQFIDLTTKAGTIRALAFLADHSSDIMAPDITYHEQVRCVATGEGFMGSSLEYLAGIKAQFDTLEIVDPVVDQLLADAQAFRARACA